MNKQGKIALISILATVLGAISSAVIWVVLKIMTLGMDLLWTILPAKLGAEHNLVYMMAVTITGGVIIGLWQKKFGLLPEELSQVMGRVKKVGSYPYDNLHILIVSALLPLIFGGVIGPEAGLTGVIVGLCCWVGDRLKCKGDELAALAQSSMGAALGVIFNAPFFGIVRNLGIDREEEKKKHSRARLVGKPVRIFIYCMGAAGGIAAFAGLGALFGGSAGLPRFDAKHTISWIQWAWFLGIVAAAILAGLCYLFFAKVSEKLGEMLQNHRIVSCVLAGVCIATGMYFLPLTTFSGEHEMGELMSSWEEYSAKILILTALAKMLLVNLCISLGWRGGSIFPLIFSGVAAGYAFAAITGIDPNFAVAAMTAGLYGYVSRKPVMTVAVLLMCFPPVYIFPLAGAAVIASKVPIPPKMHEEEKNCR